MKFKSVSFLDQKELLKERNMTFHDEERAVKTLEHISYYRIKEFAEPFATQITLRDAPEDIDYNGVKFEKIISRYYQDKNFRMYLLHVIEDIEVALQTQIAYVLGETTGDYGYLDFSSWIALNKSKEYIRKMENEIIKNLKYQIKKNQTKELKEKLKYGNNKEFPPIWLATEMLMFGDLVKILKLMSNKNISKISKHFNCTNKQLISWMGTINLVRNISAHNSNLIDIILITRPMVDNSWNEYLHTNNNQVDNNKISIILLIAIHFMAEINSKYNFKNINDSVTKLIKTNEEAYSYGFSSAEDCFRLFPSDKSSKRKGKKYRRRNKTRKYKS